MNRTWLSVAMLVAAVSGLRADGPADPNWSPAPALLPAPALTPPTPLSVKPPAAAPDVTHWVPAPPVAPPTSPPTPPAPPRSVTVDAPQFRGTPPPAGTPPIPAPAPRPVPTPVPVAPEFRPVSPEPLPVPPPAAKPDPIPVPAAAERLLPSELPTLAVPALPAEADEPKKSEPKKDPMSEPLPPPRPVTPDPVKLPAPAPAPTLTPPAPAPATYPSLTVNPSAGVVHTDHRPALEPAPNLPGTLNGVPVRGKVFGSPQVRLSRDFALRDFLGYDLASPTPAVSGELVPFGAGASGVPADNYFVEVEYLLWWANRPRIPVLATTSTDGGQGFLGQPGTVNLLGPGTFGPSLRDGFRVRVGGWLDDCTGHGFDASYFFLGRRAESRTFSGLPTLTRPFFAPNFNAEFGEVVALPNLSTGSLEVVTDSFLWGADINYRCASCRTCDRTSTWFAGYRHLNLSESLSMTEDITASGSLATDPTGTRVVVGDRFRTHNRFHGGQVGWLLERKYGRWQVGVRASVALGVTAQTLEIDGFQRRTRPGQATQSFNGGLLATGPNLGRFESSRFSVVPEATLNLGYAVTPNFQLTFGYNFLYWNNVIRPGDQIDRVVDVALVPNPPAGVAPSGQNRPQPTFTQSDFWAQGISFGARFRW